VLQGGVHGIQVLAALPVRTGCQRCTGVGAQQGDLLRQAIALGLHRRQLLRKLRQQVVLLQHQNSR